MFFFKKIFGCFIMFLCFCLLFMLLSFVGIFLFFVVLGFVTFVFVGVS